MRWSLRGNERLLYSTQPEATEPFGFFCVISFFCPEIHRLPFSPAFRMSLLTDVLYLIFAALSAPWWARTMRRGWRERLGRTKPLPAKQKPRLLIHAVSVGEVNLIRQLVDRLASQVEIVVSVTTDTGTARAKAIFADKPGVDVVRYPLDFSWSVRRFLNAVEPDAIALVELELWPTFARACLKRRLPLAIINGRLSARSVGRYRRAKPVLGRWFGSLAFCAVQDEAYRDRFISIGVPADRCHVVGTMKWDSAPTSDLTKDADQLAREMGIDRTKKLIVAGSTEPCEHTLLHNATPQGVQLLCAPRRPEWRDAAAIDLPGCVRRSAGVEGHKTNTDRFLLDTIGELRAAYALADIVVVGRSFGELYGSDPMEPAALGKPVVIGPQVTDFQSMVQTLKNAGALTQTTSGELPNVLRELIANDSQRAAMGAAARRCVLHNQGATKRHAALLLDQLASATSSTKPHPPQPKE